MSIMQTHDSRLRKAARRTIRAEATLVIVIILITTWSVYGLYKLSIGSFDSVLGLSFSSKSSELEDHNDRPAASTQLVSSTNESSNTNTLDSSSSKTTESSSIGLKKPTIQLTYSSPPTSSTDENAPIKQLVGNLLQQLSSAQPRNNDFGSYSAASNEASILDQLRHAVDSNSAAEIRQGRVAGGHYKDGYRLPETHNNLGSLLTHQQLQRERNFESRRPPLDNQGTSSYAKRNPQNYPASLLEISSEVADADQRHKLNPPQNSELSFLGEFLVPELDNEEKQSNDRVPAESSRDSSELVVKSDTMDREAAPPDGEAENQTDSAETGEQSATPGGGSGGEETASEDAEQADAAGETAKEQADDSPSAQADSSNGGEASASTTDNEDDTNSSSEQVTTTTEEPPPDEESLRETGHAIDEEVDRMTQPSSGSTLRQDRPFDYRSTVQFDDTVGNVPSLPPMPHINGPLPSGGEKSPLIMSGEAMRRSDGASIREYPSVPVNSNNSHPSPSPDSDLQVGHNNLVARSHSTVATGAGHNRSTHSATKGGHNDTTGSRTPGTRRVGDETKDLAGRGSRQKRSVERGPGLVKTHSIDQIRAPYEVDKFLENLDFDSLSMQATSEVASDRRRPRAIYDLAHSLEDNDGPEPQGRRLNHSRSELARPGRNQDSLFDDGENSNQAGRDVNQQIVYEDRVPGPEVKGGLGGRRRPPAQGQNSGEPADSGDVYQPMPSHSTQAKHPPIQRRFNNSMNDGPDNMRYHYLSSNDSSLQELLDKKDLLKALHHDQLPPPTERPPPPPPPPQPRPTKYVASSNSSHPINPNDHQTAGSLFTVDHGLLLYPSADDMHHHSTKAMAKKHKKSEKSHHKKKMTVGIKKGGHKKKKHKKEEKKFIKEKKFKGAKKGKKVAKGKGGQGGKKGKKLYKDKGFKKKGFKNVYHKEEFGQKKSYFDEYRDKDFKKKWKKFDDKYNYAKMKKWAAKDVKGAKKMKDHHKHFKKYDKSKWKKKYEKHSKEHSEKKSKKKKSHKF